MFRRGRTLKAGLDRDSLATVGRSADQPRARSGVRDRVHRPAAGEFVPVFNPGPAERRPAKHRTPPPVEAGIVDDVRDEGERNWPDPRRTHPAIPPSRPAPG
ncbi:hypothetical protein CRV15_28610 (plasmid) [Streptomyces clavuligerus]|uniref:Uncharacterized protein n=1 Tax=Streptomyces clavuligerus TaxID=1901 RepID=B5GW08_STRCL|nr:hypothetical protein SSCG_03651 [Streptomyces clavuligerus]EFG03590.1 Hypothetical protein SCLAV_p0099 [Streptomyces clavuligerus]QCS09612.1 hypothetical protein CRV15_28610 [Streptomyces clavuligerus]QPJ98339.1 hypothetical protein GE265_35720 [Streptomyces clavuligerus]